jgi:hypothetical protein
MTPIKDTNHRRRRGGHLRFATLAATLGVLAAACGSNGTEAAAPDATLPPETTAAIAPHTSAAPESTTTTAEEDIDTSAVEALVRQYYTAYNAGDTEGANGMLSSLIREISPANLRYWSGALGEHIEATCLPSPKVRNGILCVEMYTDALHGPAGLSGEGQFVYFEKNGKLQQALDPGYVFSQFPGCLENRCPGDDVRQEAGEVTWSYDRFEADLFAWLEETYPEVALEIGDARSLNYFSGNAAAAEAALPYVDEFVAQSGEWGEAAAGADLSGMTAMEAVEALFAAMNSRDPEAFEAFFGSPPDGPIEWFWAMGTRWEAECEPTDDPAMVRCEEERIDEFYSKAGAVFVQTSTYMLENGRLIATPEGELSSAYWAEHHFERAFLNWLETAYPEEHAVADSGELTHSAEGGAIAAARVDEFLSQSDEYPRPADPRER